MSDTSWIPPVELDPTTLEKAPQESENTEDAPTVVAEAADAKFESFLQANEFRRLANGILKFSEGEIQISNVSRQIRSKVLTSTGKWILLTLLGLFTIVIVQDTFEFLGEQFDTHFLFGLISTIFIGFIGVTLGIAVRDQFQGLTRLRDISRFQEATRPLIGSDTHGNVASEIARIGELYVGRAEISKSLRRYYEVSEDSHADGELLSLFSQHVLRPIDDRAYSVVAARASDTAILTAASPLAILDTILTLWRNARLVREIGQLYGARPGFIGIAKLLSHILENMAVAGTANLITDSAMETVGGNLTGAISAQVGQGIANGLMTARIGLITMQLCRPINFTDEERPKFGRVRQEIMSRVKDAVAKRK